MPIKIFAVTLLAFLCASPASAAVTPLPAPPSVTAKAYLLVDHHSGRDLAAREADEPVEPASITKVMTGYVIFRELAAGNINLQDQVSISEHAWRKSMGTSRMFLEPNTQVSAGYPMCAGTNHYPGDPNTVLPRINYRSVVTPGHRWFYSPVTRISTPFIRAF